MPVIVVCSQIGLFVGKVKVTGCVVSVVPCQGFVLAGGGQGAIISFSGSVSGCVAAGRHGVAVGGDGCRGGECVGIVVWGFVLGSVPRLVVRNRNQWKRKRRVSALGGDGVVPVALSVPIICSSSSSSLSSPLSLSSVLAVLEVLFVTFAV